MGVLIGKQFIPVLFKMSFFAPKSCQTRALLKECMILGTIITFYNIQGVQKKTALFKKLITFYVFVLGYSNRLQSKEHELYFCYRATFSRFHRILDTLVRHESRAKF